MTPKEARKIWVAALRSGKYTQVKGALHFKGGHCCLGVACEVYDEYMDGPGWQGDTNDAASYMGEISSLPSEVQEWFGLMSSGGAVYRPDSTCIETNLIAMNDNGFSFEKIAQAIEDGRVILTEEADDSE